MLPHATVTPVTSAALGFARQIKHRLFVAHKAWRPVRMQTLGAMFRARGKVLRPAFRTERYADPRGSYPFDYFLDRSPRGEMVVPESRVSRIIYCFWTGSNEFNTPTGGRGCRLCAATTQASRWFS